MEPCDVARSCQPGHSEAAHLSKAGLATDLWRICIILHLMLKFFARRTSWNLTTNRYTEALEAHRLAGREVLDLTASNPTTVGLRYREDALLNALARREAFTYEPQAKGLLAAREAVSGYYAAHTSRISPDNIILTTSTSEAYSFLFRLLCNPGDAVLVPTPSYPLFDFLADLQDVKLEPYELVYDHGWQIDFRSVEVAMQRAHTAGLHCRAVLAVHPNNPTGSFVKPPEAEELRRICADREMAIISDEVFLDYAHANEPPLTFSSNNMVLTFTLSGLSKISALPQMKIAWIAANGPRKLLSDAMNRLEVIADTYLSMNAPLQWALPVMLDERHGIQRQLLQRIVANLALLDSQLASQIPCRRLEIEGGWYAVLRVPVTGSDEDFAIAVLQATGVLVLPGHFYDFAAEGHLVISLIAPSQEFAEGTQRLLAFVSDLHA
jgi:alanine-synthesizing transaminase